MKLKEQKCPDSQFFPAIPMQNLWPGGKNRVCDNGLARVLEVPFSHMCILMKFDYFNCMNPNEEHHDLDFCAYCIM